MRRSYYYFQTFIILIGMVCAFATAPLSAKELTSQEAEFFEAKVRPILVEHCYECHSVEAEDIEAGLVLDSRWGWETGGDSGAVVVPGKLEESLLIDAVRYTENVVSGMPPRSKLPDNEIRILEQWVMMGAPDPREKKEADHSHLVESFNLKKRFEEHWSWRAIGDPQPPQVKDTSWPKGVIDRFVLARLEKANLRPAKRADKRIWIRRVYFDLVGLPPSPEQILGYLNDDSPKADEKVVRSLLDSPHFGEKWARHWMDLVRYAETYGHEFDYPIQYAHEYRDYLIRAWNADVPFDDLIREHIAGDLLEDPRRHPNDGFNESVIGTGFWYFHEATHAPTDVLGNESDIIDNQIDVFGKAFLGLTIACARCHDHKFDAISTADYYGLSAYIQSSCRQLYPLDPGGQIAEANALIDPLRREAAEQLTSVDSELFQRLRFGEYFDASNALVKRLRRSKAVKELPKDWVQGTAKNKDLDAAKLERWTKFLPILFPEAKVIVDESEPFASFDQGLQGWSTSGTAFEAVGGELALSADGDLAYSGTIDSGLRGSKQVGVLRSPTFEIASDKIHVRLKATGNVTVRVVIDSYQMASFNALLFKGTLLNQKTADTKGAWRWKQLSGDLKKYRGHKAYLEFIDHSEGEIAIDAITFLAPKKQGSGKAIPKDGDAFESRWNLAISKLRSGNSSELVARMVDAGVLSIADLNESANVTITKAKEIANRLTAPRYVVAMAEGTRESANVYIRGSHGNLGDEVPPRFIEALGGNAGSRLELANLVASQDNPLTSRVIVNRIWYLLTGRGIVPTVDDFGPQGKPATHPELLDWLATDFVQHGWSLKHVIEQIVLSQTYRQSSSAHRELDQEFLATADPTNSLLHRMRVRRLPPESIRDAVLSVSGRIDLKLFGPSVATHRTPFMTGRGARESGPLDGDGRRSIYLSVYRNFLNPFMLTFDMPGPFGPKGKRSESNVPAQALTMMNDPMVVEQARLWSARMAELPVSDQEKIAQMVELAHASKPSREQIELLKSFLVSQADQYGKLDQRSWTDLGHALFNMKAFTFLR